MMYRVEKKPNTPNIIWDAKSGKSLCRFTKGVLETDDKALADTLKGMGYTVTGGEAEKAVEAVTVEAAEEQPKQEKKPAAKKTTARKKKA